MKVKNRRATVGVRKGILLILLRLEDDFENGFEKFFPDVSDQSLIDVTEAMEWLGQYAAEDMDE